MLICDTHADTLWKMASREYPAGQSCDVTKEYLMNTPGVRVQALALYIPPKGMEQTPSFLERELTAFEQLKREGWRQITSIDQAVAGEANVMLTIEGCEAFQGNPDEVNRMAALGVRMGYPLCYTNVLYPWNYPSSTE